MKLAVAILAAGASSRMGRPKQLLPWKDTSVLGHLLRQWQELGAAQIAVVCSPANRALHNELDRLGFPESQRILNPQPDRGMFSSVQCAAAWAGWSPAVTHWAIALGDQPLVQTETLRRLLDFARAHPSKIAQPSRNGRGRHPVILPETVVKQLRDSRAENLKQFLLTCGVPVARCEMDDSGLDLDLDEPGDYERALAQENAR